MLALSGKTAFAQGSIVCGVPSDPSTVSPPCTHSWVTTSGFVVSDGEASTAPTSASATAFGTSASAATSFNSTRVSISSTSAHGGPRGSSRFLDTVQIDGGSGTGTVTFYWRLSGELQQFAPPAVCDPFRNGVDFQFFAVSRNLAFATLPLCNADARTVNRTGSFSVSFTYGLPFVQGLTVYGEAPNGLVNLAAEFTAIELPPGATVTFGSGATYPVVVTSPTVLLTRLITFVQTLNLARGISNSLDAKLQSVLQALDAAHAGDVISSCNRLTAFINEVSAQAGNSLTTDQAAQLILQAQNIRVALGCD